MIIRTYKQSDKEQLLKLLDEFYLYTRKNYSKDALRFDDYIDTKKEAYKKDILKWFLELKKSKFLVAEDQVDIIGFICGKLKDKNDKIVKQQGGHIESFFVTKKYRSKGVGKSLYNEILKWFKSKKCDFAELVVYDGNSSKEIYEKWGFSVSSYKMKKEL